jgi:hypothetical protein
MYKAISVPIAGMTVENGLLDSYMMFYEIYCVYLYLYFKAFDVENISPVGNIYPPFQASLPALLISQGFDYKPVINELFRFGYATGFEFYTQGFAVNTQYSGGFAEITSGGFDNNGYVFCFHFTQGSQGSVTFAQR